MRARTARFQLKKKISLVVSLKWLDADSTRIIPFPEGLSLVDVELILTRSTRVICLHSYETRAHPYCVDVAIRKIAFIKDILLQTDVRSGGQWYGCN
jgi:hypothetical protein